MEKRVELFNITVKKSVKILTIKYWDEKEKKRSLKNGPTLKEGNVSVGYFLLSFHIVTVLNCLKNPLLVYFLCKMVFVCLNSE